MNVSTRTVEKKRCDTAQPFSRPVSAFSRRKIRTLIVKDIQQHSRQVFLAAGFLAAAVALPAIILKDPMGRYLSSVMECAVGIVLPSQMGQWLIADERLKGTMKLLRILPISPREVAAGKLISGTIFITGSALLFAALPALVCSLVFRKDAGMPVWLFAAFLLFGIVMDSLCISMSFVFKNKYAAILPFVILSLSIALFFYKASKLGVTFNDMRDFILSNPSRIFAFSILSIAVFCGLEILLCRIAEYGYRRSID